MGEILDQTLTVKTLLGAMSATIGACVIVFMGLRAHETDQISKDVTAKVREEYHEKEFEQMKTQLTRMEARIVEIGHDINGLQKFHAQ